MLSELTIHGFKSIKQPTTIEFGRINLFIGGNGVGKSNVLEAVGMLSACLGRDISATELMKKGVRLSVPTLFKSAFKNSRLRSTFDLKAKWDGDISYAASISAGDQSEELNFFSEMLKISGSKIMGRSNHGITVLGLDRELGIKDFENRKTRGLWDMFQDFLADSPKISLQGELAKLSEFTIYSPQTAFLRGTEVEQNPFRPLGLNGGGLPGAARFVLREMKRLARDDPEKYKLFFHVFQLIASPGWTNSIEIKAADRELVSSQVKTSDATIYFIDRFMHSTRNQLSGYDSSEGTLYLLFMVTLLLHPEAPKVFGLDNVDNALNPKITRKLLEILIQVVCDRQYRELGIGPEQVFLTSHNPTSLDAFDIFDDSQRVFVVMRDSADGSTKISRLKPRPGQTKADWIESSKGRNLSELWIEGKIKGALGL